MPSAKRGEELRKIIKNIRNGTFEYDGRGKVKINWTKYDQAQIHELVDYLENVRDLVDEADRQIKERTPPEKRKPGRPPTNPKDIVKILLLQAYTGSPNRVAEGFLLLFREKLGISDHFSYKTIERGYDRESVNVILDEIVVITNEPVDNREEIYSFDGTGFSASNKENYASKRQKQNSKKKCKESKDIDDEITDDSFPKSNTNATMGFSYAVMGVGVQYKLISGLAISPDHSIGETSLFPEAFEQTLNCHSNVQNVLGDGIFACRWITDMVSRNHAIPYFLPRSNVTFKSKGYAGWYYMLYSLWENPHEWLKDYHMRSISETVKPFTLIQISSTMSSKPISVGVILPVFFNVDENPSKTRTPVPVADTIRS